MILLSIFSSAFCKFFPFKKCSKKKKKKKNVLPPEGYHFKRLKAWKKKIEK